jgi:hypothetical protein
VVLPEPDTPMTVTIGGWSCEGWMGIVAILSAAPAVER